MVHRSAVCTFCNKQQDTQKTRFPREGAELGGVPPGEGSRQVPMCVGTGSDRGTRSQSPSVRIAASRPHTREGCRAVCSGTRLLSGIVNMKSSCGSKFC